jgi:hypothetical protein
LKFQSPSRLLDFLEGKHLKNRMTSEAEKVQNVYLRRSFEVPKAIKALELPGGGVFEK